jgi:hypothetical protein
MRLCVSLFSFIRPLKSTGSSKPKSKEPQFILEDAIHAPESSFSAGVHQSKPAHVFEVRACRFSKVTAYREGLIGHFGAL